LGDRSSAADPTGGSPQLFPRPPNWWGLAAPSQELSPTSALLALLIPPPQLSPTFIHPPTPALPRSLMAVTFNLNFHCRLRTCALPIVNSSNLSFHIYKPRDERERRTDGQNEGNARSCGRRQRQPCIVDIRGLTPSGTVDC